jgi:CheY-like chemotaxis protein
MIVFIDDERRRMSSYVEELELELNQEIHFETDVDSAIDFVNTKLTEINLIFLDMMMPPGKTFQNNSETEYGLRTGLLLYNRIRAQNNSIPIVIFTNTSGLNLPEEIKNDKQCRCLQKEDYLPWELVEEVKELLKL